MNPELIYHFTILFLLGGLGLNLILNLAFFRRPYRAPLDPHQKYPLLSVLIPARNEANRITPCLESILHQDYPNLEILILDDQSEDATASIVEKTAGEDPRVRLLRGKELPENWMGKCWACHQLYEAAKGDFLVFIDADTRHKPDSLRTALETLTLQDADLLSLWPRQISKTWSEILVIPFIQILGVLVLPHWMPGRFRSLGAANGQCMLFRRSAYKKIGGHARIRNHIVDDIALAREIKTQGYKLLNADGSALLTCRMYENFRQTWEGFTKNFRSTCEDSIPAYLFILALQFFLLLGPFLFAAACLLQWLPSTQSLPLLTLQIGLIYVMRIISAVLHRTSLLSALLHPFGQTLFLLIALNSWFRTAHAHVSWKGRRYRP